MASVSTLGRRKHEDTTNWELCVICQTENPNNGILVKNPKTDSYNKLLEIVRERASLFDNEYVEIQQRFCGLVKQDFCDKNAIWHRLCYSNATHKVKKQRAKDRKDQALSTGFFSPSKRGKKDSSEEEKTDNMESTFTRSQTVPFDADKCFICQKTTDAVLHEASPANAGDNLRKAVEKVQNDVLKTRISTGISPNDARAIDIKYHKDCWRENVFHVLRSKKDETPSTNKFQQRACLVELINVVDIETKNKNYISMGDIETTYTNMMGENEIQNQVPSYSRKWLKGTILSELPHLKSVLHTNRRKPAILYSPVACESDHANAAISEEGDLDNMKAIYKAALSYTQNNK